MKKVLITLSSFLMSLVAYAQVNFEKGYLIDNAGQRIECFIKDVQWEQGSKTITYKLSQDDPARTAGIETIQEYGYFDNNKFIRITANIDKSSDQTSRLERNRNPSFSEETFFVKVLVEGNAELYSYFPRGIKRFFYKVGDSDIEQLVYKKYLTSNNKIGTNEGYKQQLWNDLNCSHIKEADIQNLNHDRKKLVNIFVRYNKCVNAPYTDLSESEGNGQFNFMVKAGINTSNLQIVQKMSDRETEFGQDLSFRIGVELEYLFPFANNKWALILEPSFYRYTATQEGRLSVGEFLPFIQGYRSVTGEFDMLYTGMELPLGVKHYFYLNEHSRMFLNGAYIAEFVSDSSEFVSDEGGRTISLNLEPPINTLFSLGVGGDYNRKYSLELKFYFNKALLRNHDWEVKQSNFITVNLGYFIF